MRFASGKDGRKQPFHQWIVLEEHASVVGIDVIWAQTSTATWQPALLWTRSAREMVTIQDQLRASEGEIRYRSANDKSDTNEIGTPIKTTHRVFGYVKTFGTDMYRFLNIRSHTRNINDPQIVERFASSAPASLQYQMAMIELAEKHRVRTWQHLPRLDPRSMVLSNRDEYALSALEVKPMLEHEEKLHATPCPSIPRGVDRSKIIRLLEQQGVLEASKDSAASIVCCSVEGVDIEHEPKE